MKETGHRHSRNFLGEGNCYINLHTCDYRCEIDIHDGGSTVNFGVWLEDYEDRDSLKEQYTSMVRVLHESIDFLDRWEKPALVPIDGVIK